MMTALLSAKVPIGKVAMRMGKQAFLIDWDTETPRRRRLKRRRRHALILGRAFRPRRWAHYVPRRLVRSAMVFRQRPCMFRVPLQSPPRRPGCTPTPCRRAYAFPFARARASISSGSLPPAIAVVAPHRSTRRSGSRRRAGGGGNALRARPWRFIMTALLWITLWSFGVRIGAGGGATA